MAEAIISRRGGGGGGLNFKVIPNPQPDTAKENTIWVDTDRINNYYFSATQPENMVDYDVWFHVGTSSPVEFNALRKNGIQVYPMAAKQYVSGVWRDVVAKSYQGGEWVDWVRYLYQNGNEFTDLSGGWDIRNTTAGSVTKNENSIKFALVGKNAQWTYGAANTKNKINLSNVRTIKLNDDFTTSITNQTTLPQLAIAESTNVSYDQNTGALTFVNAYSTSGSLDVSTFTGEYYVFVICVMHGSSNFYANLKLSEVAMT